MLKMLLISFIFSLGPISMETEEDIETTNSMKSSNLSVCVEDSQANDESMSSGICIRDLSQVCTTFSEWKIGYRYIPNVEPPEDPIEEEG